MGYTMHDAIRIMLEGRNLLEPVQFEPGEDLVAYHRYIPGLCELLRKDRHAFELHHPGMILLEIMPPNPEPFIINLLLKQLPHNVENGTLILKLLAKVAIPETVDITPILHMLDDPYYRYNAVMALKGTHDPSAEEAVLEVVREEIHTTPELARLFCDTLAAIGTIRSLPVLMATSKDFTDIATKGYFNQAIEKISISRSTFTMSIPAKFQ